VSAIFELNIGLQLQLAHIPPKNIGNCLFVVAALQHRILF